MEFLRALFNDKALTFDELVQAINEHNGNEANKDAQIKLGNLGTGEYVAKGKYDALNTDLQGKITELTGANDLIAQLKKATKNDEDLQGKISGYETQVADLQSELAKTKLKSAVKVALLSERAVDVDYLTFKLNEKLKEKGETLELDENDAIKGWDAQLQGLKTQFPTMFGGDNGNGEFKPLGGDPLPNKNNEKGLTRADLLKMPYQKRNELFENDPEAYQAAMSN